MSVATHPAYSAGAYLILCAFAVLAGRGLLRLLRIRPADDGLWLFAPTAWGAAAIVVLTTGVRLGCPVHVTAPAFWLVSAGLALAGLRDVASIPVRLLAPCLALPVVCEWKAFWAGLTDFRISAGFDTQLYIICAHAYWRYAPAQLTDALGPLYQLARAEHPFWRYGASSYLGLFSCLYRPGETQLPLGLMVAFCLFQMALAAIALGRGFEAVARGQEWLLASLVVLSGWTADIYLAGNLDQLTAMPLTLLLLSSVAASFPGWRAGAGLMVAALLCGYPDYAGVALVQAVLIRLLRRRPPGDARPSMARMAPWIAVYGLLLVLLTPVLARTVALRIYAMLPTAPARLGGASFSTLTKMGTVLPALWATGIEFQGGPVRAIPVLLSSVSTVWLLWAIADRIRRRQWALVGALAVPAGMFVVFAALLSYGYAAYKFVAIGWPLVCLLLSSSLASCRRAALRAVGGIWLLALVVIWQTRFLRDRPMASPGLGETAWAALRQIEGVKPQLATTGTLLAVKDGSASMATAYYLRDVPLRVGVFRSYMAVDVLERDVRRSAMPEIDRVQYVVADGSATPASIGPASVDPEPVLKNAAISLWRLRPDWTLATLLVEASPAIAGGQGGITAVVANRGAGGVRIRGRVVGGALPPESYAVEAVAGGTATMGTLSRWRFDFEVPCPAGVQEIRIRAVATGNAPPVAVRGDSLRFEQAAAPAPAETGKVAESAPPR